MIVIDSSALIAVVNRESERLQFLKLIAAADRRLISAATLLETKMVVLGRFGPPALADFMMLMERKWLQKSFRWTPLWQMPHLRLSNGSGKAEIQKLP